MLRTRLWGTPSDCFSRHAFVTTTHLRRKWPSRTSLFASTSKLNSSCRPLPASPNKTSSTPGLALCASCDDMVVFLKGLGGNALREGEQLVDGPLVVGVGAVLHRVDPSGRRDQEVGRQP